MADGARTALGADAAVSVTGIAGPDGGTPEKPVGLVYVGVVTPAARATESFVFSGDREAVRTRATVLSLHALRRLL
jgi:nicotinamide-nucleotide amidase